MEWFHYPLIILAGTLAGFINTVAGSGSAVTVPLLGAILGDLSLANGTNRVAILLQNVVGVWGFKRSGVGQLSWRQSVMLAVPCVIAGCLGAWLATKLSTNKQQFRFIVGIVMVIVLGLIILKPGKWLRDHQKEDAEPKLSWWHIPLIMVVGFYGGFIQLGVGVFFLLALVWGAGFDLVRGNAIKVFLIFCYTVPVLVVYAVMGQVDFFVGFICALGNMLGAWLGTIAAAKKGATLVRWVLICVVSYSALKFLGILDLILG